MLPLPDAPVPAAGVGGAGSRGVQAARASKTINSTGQKRTRMGDFLLRIKQVSWGKWSGRQALGPDRPCRLALTFSDLRFGCGAQPQRAGVPGGPTTVSDIFDRVRRVQIHHIDARPDRGF